VEARNSSGAHGRQLESRYMEVRCLDEFKVTDNIRQGGICCVCVKYCVRVGLRVDLSCIRCGQFTSRVRVIL
jgi:hypothetical protein